MRPGQPVLWDAASSSAVISEGGVYRYSLSRFWGDSKANRLATWIMLNPSTADATEDDPTIRRCIRFTRRGNYDGLTVVNLFALRATDPWELAGHADPVGPDNDRWITSAATSSDLVIAAWGNHGTLNGRDKTVLEMLDSLHVRLACLGTTTGGHPRHPLYLRKDTPMTWLRGGYV